MKLTKETQNERIYKCDCCWITRKQYRVNFSKMHLWILFKVLKYYKHTWKHIFTIKELDEVEKLSKTEYWNLNVLIRFWLLFRPEETKGGHYWVNTERAVAFIKWKWEVAQHYWRDSITKEWKVSEHRIKVHQIKQYKKFLSDNWLPDCVEYL